MMWEGVLHFSEFRAATMRILQVSFFLSFLVIFLSGFPACAAPSVNSTDRLALLFIKSQITRDPLGSLSSWNETLNFCEWHGVTCSLRHPERVIALDLEGQVLTGFISPYITNLTFLKRIHMPNNSLYGEIPQVISRLSHLQYLNLSYNSLDGKIPTTLGHCSKLQNISIRSNNLVGQIPDTLGRLPNLKVLSLATNNLIGDVPQSLGNLSSLNILNLAKNSLTGLLPSSLGNLSSLSYFDLSSNNLNGSIPEDIARITGLNFFSVSINGFSGLIPSPYFNLSSLQHFAVSVNQLTGTLPQDIGLTLPNLEDLLVDVNQFHGPIPISLSNASRLQVVDLDTNKFSGRVPLNLGSLQNLRNLNLGSNKLRAREAEDWGFITSLTNCSNLVVLGLNNNSFTGVLPSSIANLSSELQWLVMGGNQISGGIPAGIENLVNLVVLGMDQNHFTGAIPGVIGKLQWLNALDLSENNFSGQIPPSLGNLSQLNELQLGKNEFLGSIPSSLRNCQNLEALELSNNNFSGTIPIEVFNITSLSRYLDLSHNSLIGTLPMQIGSLTNLGILDVSENRLSGEIPNELGDCQVLEYLYMEGNFFQGSIPPSFGKLKGIRELDLSRNKFSGQFPDFLENLHSAQYLNLSFNNFNGEVPQGGVFNNASAISVAGNNNLCGGIPKLQLPPCPNKSSKRRKQHLAVIIIVPVVSILCSIVLLYFCIICWTKSSKAKIPSTPSSSDQHKKVSYAELYKATDGFSSENLMGVGSFGSVYKGIMDLGETAVAVKVFNLQRRGATKTFLAECEALRFVRHRNLVKILTSCSSMDFMGNEFKALVYEFMPHGSLENWLHPVGKEWCQSESLNFSKRLNIAIDVASALNYLHYHCLKPIVHCDLKPSNVLLDGTMSALVSDFGLARFLSKTFAPSGQTISIGIKGTIGYVAPEYGMGRGITTSGDVYSYGILLLEIFTGRKPTDSMFNNDLSLHNFVKAAFPERVLEIVDPSLLSAEYQAAEESGRCEGMKTRMEACLVSVIRIGLSCSVESPKERIDMNCVVRELEAVSDMLLVV